MNAGRWRWVCFLGVFSLIIAATGCKPNIGTVHEPDQIRVISPDPQFGTATSNNIKQVSIEVLTAPIPGLLGGQGSRHPVIGERIMLRTIDPECGLKALIAEGTTDSGGRLNFEVQLGTRFGDQYIEAICASRPTVKKRMRFVSGVKISNNRQEVVAGLPIPNPFRVTLVNADSEPLVGVPIYFSLIIQPGKGAQLSHSLCLTDENGAAEVELKTVPSITGVYKVSAEIVDPKNGHAARPIQLEADAIHVTSLVIGVLGGLAIFIFGMTLMSDGLQQAAGNRLKRVLAFITGNRVRAIFAGAAVAGLIQSSSATTVMTVGFVNAGLLTLKQAIGVIFGANIGTTATGQMISFNLGNMALPALTLGMLLLFILEKPTGRGVARLVFGFGLLFYGMGMMSSQLRSVSDFPSFINFFQAIDCRPLTPNSPMELKMVLQAIGIGMLSTMMVQSSAATIGLAIALANSGLLNFWTAVPIVLGDNIGTTLTAILASLSGNRTAHQTALAHSLFNVLGTSIVVALLYVPYQGVPCFYYAVDFVTKGDVFSGENVGRHIAAAHSLFNILAVVIFTPFIGILVWVCSKLIPQRGAFMQQGPISLDRSWLATPSLALDGAVRATATMAEKAYWVASEALLSYCGKKHGQFDEIKRVESETDDMQRQIMDYLMQLTRRRLSMAQTLAIPTLMHCISDAERIADIGVLIAELIPQDTNIPPLTEAAQKELDEIINRTGLLAECVMNGLHGTGKHAVEDAIRYEGQVRILFKQAEQGHISRLQSGECNIERGIVYVELLALIESIVRHLGNIATRTATVTNDLN